MTWNRGEVWCVNLTPSAGREMYDPHPAVVVSADAFNLFAYRIIVPITTWKQEFKGKSFFVKINANSRNGLDHGSAANVLQVRSVDASERFINRLGTLTDPQMDKIEEALCIIMDLPFNP
ncbi:type II toxin-antitoxin system PemK/MazF family toxin [Methanobacterium sp. CWC-01]|uniref:type II toxin-antitoxin system PemK/MazF family toxin n=1 Tax=Methanobacterium aridiramus TaxID=2584467 RepID=UPI0025787EDA|nr:type II toxin-antitoxin system PemK/MazF family toxin [Methanobacterium sp. CWC-01]